MHAAIHPKKRVARRLASLSAAALLLTGAPGRAAVYVIDEAPLEQEKIGVQHFNFYLPDAARKICAVVVIQHGNANVPDLAAGWAHGFGAAAWDAQWRALADRWDAGVVFPCLEGKDCHWWYDPKNGGWRALNDALAVLGNQSGHPEVASAPLCLYGFSCGGDWAGMMMKEHPERILAAVARSGGSDPGAGADGVPVLLVQGGAKDRYKNEKWFTQARGRGALVAFAEDTDQGHTPADLNVLAVPFFDACLALRLPDAFVGSLKLIDPSVGWLGERKTYAVSAAPAFAGDRATACWLPSEILARKWSEFANPAGPRGTGWVTDTTAPIRAPDEVAAIIDGDHVTLSWHAVADVESGIKNFPIYRDGRKIATPGGTGNTNHGGRDFFQWSWDTRWPTGYPVLPPTQWPFPAVFSEEAVPPGRHIYEIAVVNAENLEGPRSPAATVLVGRETAALAPVVVSSPQDVHLVEVLRASFTVSVSGTGPMTYQWRKNGVALPDAMGATYIAPAATMADDGAVFTVAVTGPGGSVTSRGGTMFVRAGHSAKLAPPPAPGERWLWRHPR